MKKTVCGGIGWLACLTVLSAQPCLAAELLDVKPNVSAGSVSVEVTADIPMTYTYYKVPGEARAVVDIADADPEKVEPLIVVNKGAVSSISVDKAMISSMTVSRLVFNLVSETDINVIAADDRKKLTVTFGKGGDAATAKPAVPVATAAPAPAPAAVTVTPPVPAPVAKVDTPAVSEPAKQDKEDDPLGLDEPQPAASAPKASSAAPAVASPSVVVVPKLAPVVPAVSGRSSEPTVVTDVTIANKTIDIVGKSAFAEYKTMTLNDPARLVIDIPGTKGFSGSSFPVKKFGIEKVRVATNGSNVRVVLDASSAKIPAYKIVKTAKGLQIQF